MQTKIHTQYKRNKKKQWIPPLFFFLPFWVSRRKKIKIKDPSSLFFLYIVFIFLIKNNQLNHNLIIENKTKQNQTKQNQTKQNQTKNE